MTDKTECPRCNSLQEFKLLARDTNYSWQEIYIKCKVCRWERVLEYTTPKIEQAKRRLAKFEERAKWEASRHGWAQHSTETAMARAQQQITELRDDIREEMDKHGVEADRHAA